MVLTDSFCFKHTLNHHVVVTCERKKIGQCILLIYIRVSVSKISWYSRFDLDFCNEILLKHLLSGTILKKYPNFYQYLKR